MTENPSSKKRSRVSYPAAIRAEAKAIGGGLITVSVMNPDGTCNEFQRAALAKECHFARWMGELLTDPDRDIPEVSAIYEAIS